MMNKRGLSEVITIVLIILLTLVAILIVWAFIRPTIESTGEQVGADCLLVELKARACNAADNRITVERGADGATLDGLRFVFSDGSTLDNNPADTLYGALPSPLESKVVAVNGDVLPNTDVNVAAKIGGQVCPVSTSVTAD